MTSTKAGSHFYDRLRSLKMNFFTVSAFMIYFSISAGESCTEVSFSHLNLLFIFLLLCNAFILFIYLDY